MPRVARIVIPGVPHNITQRGNNRQDVFFVDDDRRVYLELLAAQAERFGLKLLGYCLMNNHVHLVATPDQKRCQEELLRRQSQDRPRAAMLLRESRPPLSGLARRPGPPLSNAVR